MSEGDKGRSVLYLDADLDGQWDESEIMWTSGWVEYTDGPGEYPVPDAYAYDAAGGTYTFAQESVNGAGQRIAYEEPGNPNQTVKISTLEITTQIQSDREVVVGQSATIWDVVTVTGDVPDGAMTTVELFEWPKEGPRCGGVGLFGWAC